MKLVFREKREFHLFYYNVIFKDRVLFKSTQWSIDVTVVKNIYLFKFSWKLCKIKVKKEN